VKPLPFVWPDAAAFWLVCVWVFSPEWRILQRSRAEAERADSADAGSFRFIIVGQWLALFAAFPLALWESTQLPPRFKSLCFWLGLLLLLGGSLLRRHCWRLLGESFTAHVRAKPGQPVVDRGAYKWIRHPSYLAGIVMFVGIGLALGNWASLLVLSVATVVVFHYRITVEERVLEATLGEPYRAFMRTRKRLIPFIY
jgi:protein-S-isoprenylcysteine O-methyltransferase Ste14